MTYSAVRPAVVSFGRRLVIAAVIVTSVLVGFLPRPALADSASCQFVFGFKTLHDLIPTTVGNCVNNQTIAPNGDATQVTTWGLLDWRKVDNHTAFTDGYRTWVLGPYGLQERLNTARFTWEADAPPPNVDPRLAVAYQIAAGSRFSPYVSFALAHRTPIEVANLGGNFGDFSIDPQTGHEVIAVDQSLVGSDPNDAAAVIVHEVTHAYDASHLAGFGTTNGCFQTELRAMENEITFWGDQFGAHGKQPATDQFESQKNAQILLAQSNIQALVQATYNDYSHECGLS